MTIALFNPSILSRNLGDVIILDAVSAEISRLFPNEHIIDIPTQEKIGPRSIRLSRNAQVRFLGGTNLLSSRMLMYKQWQINLLHAMFLRDITLLGVGWWQYQADPDCYTRTLLTRVLGRTRLHSVRDGYTLAKLGSIGIKNVINTGCPTMWQLTREHCDAIPKVKAEKVVFTLTDYHKFPRTDIALVSLLKNLYDEVYFWPQGAEDLNYLHELGVGGIRIIGSSVTAYDKFLRENSPIDFVGTRLHGGVRALQLGHRALILAVDNRACEISRHTNLAVVDRGDLTEIKNWIVAPAACAIRMDFGAINYWRAQFREEPLFARYEAMAEKLM